uniref:mitogen-activated protein kinase kinase n=1 Tax=Acrobeloides nanus TaxID=290746 RepID=A0A914CHY8_9BILA
MLTLDTLFEYVENDQTYTQYKKLKKLEGINNIHIPGYEKSFLFDKMDFESKTKIFYGTRVIVEHYRYKPTNTEMAVKFLRIPFSFSNDKSEFELFLNSIRREMNTCKELPSSPNLVELYGFCIYGGYILICMEYMDMSLYDLYKQFHQQHGCFHPRLLGIIAVSIVDALRDLKSKNIMHRDIKPRNILINKQGQIKLCDFGVSRILVDSLASTVTTGTVLYWPPERFDMNEEDVKYDIHVISQDLPNSLKEFIKNCLQPFDARPSYTELIRSSLYTEYKEIAQTEAILYVNKIILMRENPGLSHQQDISRDQSSSSLYIIPKEEVSVKIRVLILSCPEHKWTIPPRYGIGYCGQQYPVLYSKGYMYSSL